MPIERIFESEQMAINYAEYPDPAAEATDSPGLPLVLLHGGSARWQASLSIIPELSLHYHLYAPDLRGHGKSGRSPGRYTLADYAEDIASFLANVVETPAALYGHSLGGQVAIVVAALHPQLVSGLIIGDAPFDRGKLSANLMRERERLLLWQRLAGGGHSTEEITLALKRMPLFVEGRPAPLPAETVFGADSPWFPYMAENLRLHDPAMLAAVIEFDKMHGVYDYEQLFPRISCPTLIIQGNPRLGGGLSDEEVYRALELLPNASVARLETVGHTLDYPDKQPLLAAMTSFLDTLQAKDI
jgi:pimeloyl-ACP methyl ester carboxylesterase